MARKKQDGDAGQPGFEDLLAEAEALAEKMEEGGLSLDESISAYEQGVGNLKRCAEFLRDAEEKVKVLLEKDGGFSLRDLDTEADDGESEEEY